MRILVATSLVACALALGGCASSTLSDTSPPAEIVQARCTKCHNTDRIKAAKHDQAGWTSTVTRMRGKGAQLTQTQADAVITFLAGGGASQL